MHCCNFTSYEDHVSATVYFGNVCGQLFECRQSYVIADTQASSYISVLVSSC